MLHLLNTRRKTTGFVILIILLGVLFTRSALILDPDFGYRLKNGEYILKYGLPREDLYSYTMPSFPYVEHAWLVATGFFLVHNRFGYYALSLSISAVALLALILSAKRTKLSGRTIQALVGNRLKSKRFWYLYCFPFFLAFAAILPFVGVRAQVVSWLMISVLVYVLLTEKLWKRWRLLIPVFFILWSNLHGSFAAGIAILLIVVFTRSIRLRKLEVTDVLIILTSVGATLVNPYGSGAWREVWSSVSDPLLRKQILEWQSPIFVNDFPFWAFFAFAVMVLWKYRRKFKLEESALFLGVLFQTMLSRRHAPILVIVSLPMIMEGIGYLYSEIRTIKFGKKRFYKSLYIAWLGAIVILVVQVAISTKGAVAMNTNFYPKEALVNLKNNLPEGRIFSKYGWGGYLIWKLPEKKVFIDGRMPSWRYSQAPEGQSNYAFQEYVDILSGDLDYKPIFQKYRVDTVLWPVPTELGKLEELSQKIMTFLGKDDKNFSFTKQLESDGWQNVYEDPVAIIYKSPN